MKTYTLIAILLTCSISAHAEGPQIVNPKFNNVEVLTDNNLQIKIGEKVITLSNQFISKDINLEPTAPIQCVWDKANPYVAIFVQYPRATEIHVVNYQQGTILKQEFSKDFPEWYDRVFSALNYPNGDWSMGRLPVKTVVTMRDGTKRESSQTLEITSAGFKLSQLK